MFCGKKHDAVGHVGAFGKDGLEGDVVIWHDEGEGGVAVVQSLEADGLLKRVINGVDHAQFLQAVALGGGDAERNGIALKRLCDGRRDAAVGPLADGDGETLRFDIGRGVNDLVNVHGQRTDVGDDEVVGALLEGGCLSVLGPDGLPVYSNVRRPANVVVEWTNEHGDKLSAKMSGVPARIVQHETDHLDGVLFIDYLSGVKREMLMRKVNRGHK